MKLKQNNEQPRAARNGIAIYNNNIVTMRTTCLRCNNFTAAAAAAVHTKMLQERSARRCDYCGKRELSGAPAGLYWPGPDEPFRGAAATPTRRRGGGRGPYRRRAGGGTAVGRGARPERANGDPAPPNAKLAPFYTAGLRECAAVRSRTLASAAAVVRTCRGTASRGARASSAFLVLDGPYRIFLFLTHIEHWRTRCV